MSSKAYQEAYKYMNEEQKDAMYKLWQGCINHDGHSWNTFTEIENTVAELLKKQIPKKPICDMQPYSEEEGFNDKILCPVCGGYVGFYNESMDEPEQTEYCCECGQHIAKDWSDEE